MLGVLDNRPFIKNKKKARNELPAHGDLSHDPAASVLPNDSLSANESCSI
jgi:hypothetical protein